MREPERIVNWQGKDRLVRSLRASEFDRCGGRWIVNCKAEHMSARDPSVSAAKRVAETFPAVVEQDHWALERQQAMFEYPDEGYSELFLKPDKALRRARHIFVTMLREEQSDTLAPAKAAR